MRDKFAPLLIAHDFTVIEETTNEMVLESLLLQAVAVLDPRGELDVRAFPKGNENWEGFSYSGMVGRASVERLLEIALEQMQADPRILEADAGLP